MATIATWAGVNATLGTVTNGTAGDGDTPFTHTNGTLTVVDSGPHPTRIELPNSGIARCGWWQMSGYPHTSYAARFYLTMTSYPVEAASVMRTLSSNSDQCTVRITTNGYLSIRDDVTPIVRWNGTVPLPLGVPVRIELTVDNGAAFIVAYEGDTMTVIESYDLATVGSAAVNEIWFGRVINNNTGSAWWIDDLAMADTADLIGPAREPAITHRPWLLVTSAGPVPLIPHVAS